MISHICFQCKNEFKNYFKTSKFCSPECYWASMQKSFPKREIICPICKNKRVVKGFRKTLLCLKCSATKRCKGMIGEKNPSWKGGESKDNRGYIHVIISSINDIQIKQWVIESNHHKKRATTVLKHRLLMIQKLRRPLNKKEIVHHLNGIKSDNSDINLMNEDNIKHRKMYFELLEERNLLIYKLRQLGINEKEIIK